MPQAVNVTFLLPASWGPRTRFQNPTLLIQRPGHVFVQDHIRRPTTRRVASDRCGPSSIRCTPYGERVSARSVRVGVGGEAVWGFDPACVDVECSGAVF